MKTGRACLRLGSLKRCAQGSGFVELLADDIAFRSLKNALGIVGGGVLIERLTISLCG